MTRMGHVVLALSVAMAVACGGKSKGAVEPSPPGGDDDAEIPPERMDEIKAQLDRKRTGAGRCMRDAINAGTIKPDASGHVALGFMISEAGVATDVKVIESSIGNAEVEACVISTVQQIDFGALPRALDWSYTFAFESM